MKLVTKDSYTILITILIFLSRKLILCADTGETLVNSITPREGSLNGATAITIAGKGFSKNQFNFGDGQAHLGNQVTFVSSKQSYACDVLKEASHETQITCYTRRMPNDLYNVHIAIDGEEVPETNHCQTRKHLCQFQTKWERTPKITSVEPTSGPPGTIIKVTGVLFTSLILKTVEEGSNGRSERLRRVYIGIHKCELYSDETSGELHGIQLDKGGTADTGWFKCKIISDYIGNMNVSFLVSGYFGRSRPLPYTMFISRSNQLHMFQTFAVISQVSPSTGSLEGGTEIHITGNFFDASKPRVTVGGQLCEIIAPVTLTEIICRTASHAPVQPHCYPGNRGVYVHIWQTDIIHQVEDLKNVRSFPMEGDAYERRWHDGAGFADDSEEHNDLNQHGVWLEGYFNPPIDGVYTFYLAVDDMGVAYFSESGDPADKEKILECPSNCGYKSYEANLGYDAYSTQVSKEFNLTADKPYYFEIISSDSKGVGNAYLGVRIPENKYHEPQTTNAWNERQTLSITSTVQPLKEVLRFQDWTGNIDGINEVQKVTVTSVSGNSNNGATFELGLYGAKTSELTLAATASEVKSALQGLPSITTVTVSEQPVDGGKEYTIAINDDLGDIPDLSWSSQLLNVEVEEITKGLKNVRDIRLKMENTVSGPVLPTDDTQQLEETILAMFAVTCHPEVDGSGVSSQLVRYHFDFEDPENPRYADWGTFDDGTSFCGRRALKNPQYLFKMHDYLRAVEIARYKYACFAYKGGFQSKLKATFSWSFSGDVATRYINYEFIDVLNATDTGNSWKYTCVPICDLILAAKPDGDRYSLERLEVFPETADSILDEVQFRRDVNEDLAKLLTVRQDSAGNVRIKEISVTKMDENEFHITLFPYNCASNFEVFSLVGVEVQSDDMVDDVRTVVYRDGRWPDNQRAEVQLLQQSSPPVTGSFDLTFGENTIVVMADIEASGFQSQLQTMAGMGHVDVHREGGCQGYSWTISWLDMAGDLPTLQVDGSNLEGAEVNIEINTLRDGGVFYKIIPGEMVKSCEEKPQVAVYINDIPTKCTGNCDFEWLQERTPVVTAINPTSGSLASKTVLTVTGSGLEAVPLADSVFSTTVEIGEVLCDITSHTNTEIVCNIGTGPLGPHDVYVNVEGKGLASGIPQQFSYEGAVTSITPSEASYAGGIILTISGSGFSGESSVTIGDIDCPVNTFTYTILECVVPSKPVDATSDSAPVVVVSPAGDLTSPQNFQYSQSSIPTITGISLSQSGVWGADDVWLTGTTLLSSNVIVKVCESTAMVSQSNDTHIEITLPPNPPGFCPLTVQLPAIGYADLSTHNIPDIEYKLTVSAVYPAKGSLYGGTKLTISGAGFPIDPSLLTIGLGEGQSCDVEDAAEDTIVCKVGSARKRYEVNNFGTHPEFGTGYAWNPSILEIETGDEVLWEWVAPLHVPNVVFTVQQIQNPQSNEAMEAGFSHAVTGTPSGEFIHQFPVAGTYHYWSGPIDHTGLVLKGVIKVSQKSSTKHNVTVRVAGYDAMYDDDSGISITPSGDCVGTTAPKPRCTESSTIQTSDVSAQQTVDWTYSKCHTPVINEIKPRKLFLDETITITGNGFGDLACENEVLIGDVPCLIDSNTPDTITCHADLGSEPPVNTQLLPSLRVHNRGYALIEIIDENEQTVIFDRYVSDVSPRDGSTEGGTLVTITGAGFPMSPKGLTVFIGSTICDVIDTSYTELRCDTRPAVAAVDVPVIVSAMGDIKCRLASCVFSYSVNDAIVVTSVTTTSLSMRIKTITLQGNFDGIDINQVEITVGTTICTIISNQASAIQCQVENLVTGSYTLQMKLSPYGLSHIDNTTISVSGSVDSISPKEGSILGGTSMTISGGAFDPESTSVTIGDVPCVLDSVQLETIVCITPVAPNAEGEEEVVVLSNGQTLVSPVTYTYTLAKTPRLSLVSPLVASSSVRIQLRGEHFSETKEDNIFSIGEVPIPVTYANDTVLECDIPDMEAGRFSVALTVRNLGRAKADKALEFQFIPSVSDYSPKSGSFGGGQILTFTGSGLMSSLAATVITVCEQPCHITENSLHEIHCRAPQHSGSGSVDCVVTVSVNDLIVDKSLIYTYSDSKTPRITNVSPRRAGTGGGTKMTIEGTNFGNDPAELNVTIADVPCDVDTSETTPTTVVCMTHSIPITTKTKVRLQVSDYGIASQESADFEYIDLWSSVWTWGGESLPVEGDLVVIQHGQTVLLDTDTPVLKMILIQGGSLIFDRKDIELNAEYILVTNGGLFQVGTEDDPFLDKAEINLHGNWRSKELPIYGTKVLAVREGTLDLHGRPVPITWTHLAETASAGSTSLVLKQAVNWQVGDQIMIATTGHRHSQRETEVRNIVTVLNEGFEITIDEPLEYSHISVEENINGHKVEMRGEVGLLTRNIRVMGKNDLQWDEDIEACPDGFDTGDYTTQTCFQGRFGDEKSSDQLGGHIILHTPAPNTGTLTARIEYVEFNYVGQAFRLGRYPIHFHLLGDMAGSYVRGCAIHETFNRAINIRGTHDVLIEHNVVYNVLGGALFLEDGIETGNILQYNLAVLVKSSTSLLNDDITPASFWITNPDNTVRHNAAAGGTHFGFWYRMHKHPDGPSYTRDICPQKVPLGEFYNNSAHSMGWYGLWIFKKYNPTVDGGCKSKRPAPAVFRSLSSWHCDKGAEWVDCSDIQFIGFILVNNEKAGVELKLSVPTVSKFTESGPMVADGLIVGHTSSSDSSACTTKAMILPFGTGLTVKNMVFINFDRSCDVFGVTFLQQTCSKLCGGWHYFLNSITLENSPNLYGWRWEHEGVLVDQDGSLTSGAPSKLLPWSNSLPQGKCNRDSLYGPRSTFPGAICSNDVTFIRLAFNHPKPNSLRYKNTAFKNNDGITSSSWERKRLTHKDGWMVVLPTKNIYEMEFENVQHMSNISYDATFYEIPENNWLIMKMKLWEKPDRIRVRDDSNREGSHTELSYSANYDGDWYYNTYDKEISYIVSDKVATRRKRNTGVNLYNSYIKFKASKCFYPDCIAPKDPSEETPVKSRPETAMMWSDSNTWSTMEMSKPVDNEDVIIKKGLWVVADENLPRIKTLLIEGSLEFEYEEKTGGGYFDFDVHLDYLIIKGGLIIGWPDNPYKGSANIYLHGSYDSPYFNYDSADLGFGPELGSKVIGVFGRLDMHGSPTNTQWTELSQTATAGSTQITVENAVDWAVGNEVLLTTTSYDAWQTETFTITSVSDDSRTLGLNDSLQHRHLGSSYEVTEAPDTIPHKSYSIKAKVGLLTKNIKIIGASYEEMLQESFGARILVSAVGGSDRNYVGFARLSNVEFYHTGQGGFTEYYDPRYSLAFLDTGDVNEIRPSLVKNCSFHNGFSPALGVFGTNKLVIENNVVHHTIGNGMQVWGQQNVLVKNLVALSIWSGYITSRRKLINLDWPGGIEANKATGLTLRDNVVAGSDRSGYNVPGETCGMEAPQYTNNQAIGTLSGVTIFPKYGLKKECILLHGFTVVRAYDFGIYYQAEANLEISASLLVDNGLGIFPMVTQPPSRYHKKEDKFVKVELSTFIGSSPDLDCSTDVYPNNENSRASKNGRSFRSPTNGKIAMCWPNFISSPNGAPRKSWLNYMSYGALGGSMLVTECHFDHYTVNQCGQQDVVFSPNPGNQEIHHPVTIEKSTHGDLNLVGKFFIPRPDIGKINPSDCVDMDCDGMKKSLFKDSDGSLLGDSGTVIPQSEYKWDGDPSRGLGDYRIPKAMLTDPAGNRLDVADVVKAKGIIRSDSCVYHEEWQAYGCADMDHEMLVIESLDKDTEKRRLSPVAVLGNGYLDLINGPEDHGWCNGYTCQERLSTFFALVATGYHFDIYFTSTNPQKLRLTLLNVSPTEAVRVAIYYPKPERLDVYVDGKYIQPTNAIQNDDSQMVFQGPEEGDFLPDFITGSHGDNYLDRLTKQLYVMVKGSEPVDILVSPLIVLSFNVPAVSVDEFFGENLVNNLALLLGIDTRRIKLVNVVAETKRKRAAETTIVVEISDEPMEEVDMTTNATVDDMDMARDAMLELSNTLILKAQLGELGTALNVTLLSLEIEESMPPTGNSEWENVAEVLTEVGSTKQSVLIPDRMYIVESSNTGVESSRLNVVPVLEVLDDQGMHLPLVGSIINPWEVTASLVNGTGTSEGAELTGTKTIKFVRGYANFTDLSISHSGTGFMIEFRITKPREANLLVKTVGPFTITRRCFSVRTIAMAARVAKNSRTSVMVEVIDVLTNKKAEDIFWRGHSWTCSLSLSNTTNYPGTLDVVMDTQTINNDSTVTFTDLQLSHLGRTAFTFDCQTSPESDYSFAVESSIFTVTRSTSEMPVADVIKEVEMKFDEVFAVVSNQEDLFIAVVDNYLTHTLTEVMCDNYTIWQGSILVHFTMAGPDNEVTEAIEDLWMGLQSGMSVQFGNRSVNAAAYLVVDGDSKHTHDVVEEAEDNSLGVDLIIGISVGVGLLIFILIIVFLLCFKKSKKQVDIMDAAEYNKSVCPNRKAPYSTSAVEQPCRVFSPRSFSGVVGGSDVALRSKSPTTILSSSSNSNQSATSRELLVSSPVHPFGMEEENDQQKGDAVQGTGTLIKGSKPGNDSEN